MVERSVEELTLRELFNDSQRLTRELIEHLDQGFLPKVRELTRLVRPAAGDPEYEHVEDITVRNHAARVLESEAFTQQLYIKVEQYYRAIDANLARVVRSRKTQF